MIKKEKSKFSEDEDNDPMSTVANLTDVMLVLAVGFLILAITSNGIVNIENNTMQAQQSPSSQMIDVEQGQEISEDSFEKSNASGSGYSKVGQVYQDPKTGKLVMINE